MTSTVSARVALVVTLLASLLVALPPIGADAAPGDVFINELHYDNAGTDTGEFIEVAGPAGTDLSTLELVLYNGNGGASYDTVALSGVLPDEGGTGFGAAAFFVAGIQNGAPDGIALVQDGTTVVQFLSYEGTLTAVGGPADGTTSTDIGVAEPGDTPIGQSLQLIGTSAGFAWSGPSLESPNALNDGQLGRDGSGTGDGGPDADPATGVFLNEVHYDNAGSDVGEFVEVAGPAGTALDGWSVVLYNGNGGGSYGTIQLIGLLSGTTGTGVAAFGQSGIQNGAPDGLAVVDPTGAVTEFLSYEGAFEATDGPAAGTTSVDLGVAESSDTAIGDSLQRTGDCSWTGPLVETRGAVNADQAAACDAVPPMSGTVINEVLASHTGTDDTEFVELFGEPNASLAGLSVVSVDGDEGDADIFFRLDLPDDATLGDNGFLLIGNPIGLSASYGVSPNIDLGTNAFKNDTTTFALVETASLPGGAGTDVTGGEVVLDAVAITDGTPGDVVYFAAPVLGPDGSFLPAGVRRVVDGVDTDAAADWALADFGLGDENTPTAGTGIAPPPPTEPTLISAIQGDGFTSPLVGQPVLIEGVVVGDFQDDIGEQGDLNGFFVQEQDTDADANPATSEGIFVFQGNDPTVDVAVGDTVRVVGTVDEFFGMTQVDDLIEVEVIESGVLLPTAGAITLPYESEAALEAVEGMLVTTTQTLYVTEYFNLDRFGEMLLTQEPGGLVTPTQITEPGSPEYDALADANSRSVITLDDGSTVQNPEPVPFVDPILDDGSYTDNRRRGDAITGLTGVLNYSFGLYRIQVDTSEVTTEDFTTQLPRPDTTPDVGGDITIASFNVLNYFTTIDDGSNDICGASQMLECRGADSQDELDRQTAKTVTAIAELDADVLGLIEIENTPGVDAVGTLVDALNAELGDGTYAAIDTGVIGTDAIKQAFIYQPDAITPVGSFAVLDSEEFVNGLTDEPKNRPALAQTFADGDGAQVTVVVNHLKSKGSGCGDGDDATDGSGNCNGTRTAAAQALVDWLQTDPTDTGAVDQLVIGDLNAYAMEDPIDVFVDAGFVNTVLEEDPDAYGYVFDGQHGTLDYALASASLVDEVTGAAEFGINADEADLIDYDISFKTVGYFNPDIPYRASDHDPVVVGLSLVPTVADAGGPYEVKVGRSLTVDASASTDGVGAGLAYAWDLDGDGEFDDATGPTATIDRVTGPPGERVVSVQVTDAAGTVSVDEAEVDVTPRAPGRFKRIIE